MTRREETERERDRHFFSPNDVQAAILSPVNVWLSSPKRQRQARESSNVWSFHDASLCLEMETCVFYLPHSTYWPGPVLGVSPVSEYPHSFCRLFSFLEGCQYADRQSRVSTWKAFDLSIIVEYLPERPLKCYKYTHLRWPETLFFSSSASISINHLIEQSSSLFQASNFPSIKMAPIQNTVVVKAAPGGGCVVM
ncbi:hypothetical protein PDE_07786 [Penicillium oxalicum 114-2]|uniref:Uncharacterized protein n=1 Tax=Penicillium oxalicum (strain 114-2 / CGMCC 5302) TaxID=933388 RepID=S7ZVS0_PENO1|nr:hypothetical protein PDE_07786 [Penicillium oxalicum 114-2]